jgi:hypothetical protein
LVARRKRKKKKKEEERRRRDKIKYSKIIELVVQY